MVFTDVTHFDINDLSCPQETGSYVYMDQRAVYILEAIAKRWQYKPKILLGYTSRKYADSLPLLSTSAHRTGHAIKFRVSSPLQRLRYVEHLILYGVQRIAIHRDYIYFDTDTSQKPGLYWHS